MDNGCPTPKRMANSCLHLSVIFVHVKPPPRLHSVQFKSIDFLIDVDHQLYQDATALTLHLSGFKLWAQFSRIL